MNTDTIGFGRFRVDPRNHSLWKGERELRVTPKAFAVLQYLLDHAGHVVTKDELFQRVWPNTVVSEAALTA